MYKRQLNELLEQPDSVAVFQIFVDLRDHDCCVRIILGIKESVEVITQKSIRRIKSRAIIISSAKPDKKTRFVLETHFLPGILKYNALTVLYCVIT